MLTFPPDATFVIQIVSFFVLWFGLKRLLFDPFLGILEERAARTSGARTQAGELTEEARVAQTEYEERMREVRRELARTAETARSATEKEERRILSEARDQASAQVSKVREELRTAAQQTEAAMGPEAQTLATLLLERVLGRPVG